MAHHSQPSSIGGTTLIAKRKRTMTQIGSRRQAQQMENLWPSIAVEYGVSIIALFVRSLVSIK